MLGLENSGAPIDVAATTAKLRDIHIETDRGRDFETELHLLFQKSADGVLLPKPVRFTDKLETHGIAFIEAAGGGKTTAISRVLKDCSVLAYNPSTSAARYVHVSVESPATQKSLGIAVLKALGIDHISPREKNWAIWQLVRKRFAVLGIVVLWIDEAHDLLDARSPRGVDEMPSMLKSLMQGDEAVIVVLSGTERLGKVVQLDPQTSRRFAKLRPRDLVIGPDTDDVENLVRLYCAEAKMQLDVSENLANRLIHASRGRFGRIVETTIDAIQRALNAGETTLDCEHFATSWGVQEGCSWSQNVFNALDWANIELDTGADAFEATRGRALPRQRRG